jgi:hypothetical protein
MALLDSIVDASFRDDAAGRVVVFSGGRRNQGYLVRSVAEELKIRSFLKMFMAAHIAILVLGVQLAAAWSHDVAYAFDRPAHHLLRTICISLGIYSVVVALPYFLLWRSYRKALFSFVSTQDEVSVSAQRPKQPILIGVGLAAFGALILLGVIFWLTRFR